MKKILAIFLIVLFITGCATSARVPELFNAAKPQAVRSRLPVVLLPHGRAPNAAGGVSVDIDFANVGDKVITSVTVLLTAYNRDGKQVSCEVKKKASAELTATGYLRPNTGYYSRFWENVWYSTAIVYLQVNAVMLTYFDDTQQVINKPEDLDKLVIPSYHKNRLLNLLLDEYPIGCKLIRETH